MSMNEIVHNLWVGDLPSALDTVTLQAHNIRSILTAMRGRITIKEVFARHQINIDDTDDSDILQHFVPAITFVQAELNKGSGVLVHCQAGMSRSVTIVAAYLMVTEGLDVEGALDVIRKARPNIQPNEGFLRQLEIFHQASFKVSKRDKETRLFYLERVVNEVMNGDGEFEMEMFAKFPYTPSDTPVPLPRRRIRCKMCRQELAAREHMLDHGQLGPPTPAVLSAANSRRPSMNDPKPLSPLASGPSALRRASSSGGAKPLTQGPPAAPSSRLSRSNSLHDSHPRSRLGSISEISTLRLDNATVPIGRTTSELLSESAFDEDSSDEEPSKSESAPQEDTAKASVSPEATSWSIDAGPSTVGRANANMEFPLMEASAETVDKGNPQHQRALVHPTDLATQLAAHPKLNGLRPPAGLSMTPLIPVGGMSPTRTAPHNSPVRSPNYFASISPPILANSKCSGYFVEPMKWMEPFLEQGHMAGKIICPNKKCGAKLGNYDWAGVCCSCKEWVVPGFCIHRSKVDEIV